MRVFEHNYDVEIKDNFLVYADILSIPAHPKRLMSFAKRADIIFVDTMRYSLGGANGDSNAEVHRSSTSSVTS